MIDKLILSNFQAHKSTEIEFCPGVNCLTGESDEGKTSIIRALYWAAQNKPSGGDFISDFSKKGECSSTIVIDNNEVTRLKTKTKNEYIINGQSFKALGKGGIPDEVKDILQMDELNFQNQMDSPFLLSASSGEVARYLNDIVNLNVIDESLKKINAKVNRNNAEIESKESEIESNKTELEESNWLEQAEKKLLKLEEDYLQYKADKSKQEFLIDLLEECDDLEEKLEQYKDTEQELNEIDTLFTSISTYNNSNDLLIEFESFLNNVKSIYSQIGSLAFNEKEIGDIILLQGVISEYQINKSKLVQFTEHLNIMDVGEEDIIGLNQTIEKLEIEFENEFPSECPLCGVYTEPEA
jgi:exonuclease SbcC